MRRVVYGLAAGVLAGLLFFGVDRREKPIEAEYRKIQKEVMGSLRENDRPFSVSVWPKYEPFEGVPFLERVTLGEIREGRRDIISSKYGEICLSVNRDDYFCIQADNFPVFFADIDGDAYPDEFFSCRWGDSNYKQKSGKRKIEEIQQPFQFILKGVYRALLREAHKKLIIHSTP